MVSPRTGISPTNLLYPVYEWFIHAKNSSQPWYIPIFHGPRSLKTQPCLLRKQSSFCLAKSLVLIIKQYHRISLP